MNVPAYRIQQSGFSAVELMITLFIAAAFVASGYMVYSVIVKDSTVTRQSAQANSIAYTYLRTYAAQASGSCSPRTETPTLLDAEKKELPKPASIKVSFTCPHSATPSLWKVNVALTYGSTTQEVTHATFVTR